MRLAVLSAESLKNEFLEKGIPDIVEVIWATELNELVNSEADAFIDLTFENTPERIEALGLLLPKPVLINAVTHTLEEIGQPFIRINAWPGFLNRSITEIATAGQDHPADIVFKALGWAYKTVPDQPGMIAPRVVAMIVNEAYFALGEQVSTKAEIDTAMKLGTNYPFGPFEWGEKIGLEKIRDLLFKLSVKDDRYLMAQDLK
jgi:3-hydroxybutyryl-CoA dehydrogenase